MDGDKAVRYGFLNMSNKNLFLLGMYPHYNPTLNQYRVRIGNILVACIASGKQPASKPDQVIVSHANGNLLDNWVANLHWVMPSFNTLNNTKCSTPSSGFFGVCKAGNKGFQIQFAKQHQGTYRSAETAVRVYNC